MTKYILKKDTPFYKKGTEFCEDWFHKGVLLNDNCNVVANLNELDNPDEWFEKVEEGVEWLHDGASYYHPVVSCLAKKFMLSYNEYLGDAYDKARRQIGFCYKTEKSCQRFIDFLTAVEAVSHDEGFMKYNKICCEVWELRRVYLDVNGLFTAHKVESEFMHDLGAFYFDTEEHAKASTKKHPNEWQTILDYDWSKGKEEEDD